MATNMRLVIGATIIDSIDDAGASASTIEEATLGFPIESGVAAETAASQEVIRFRIRVKVDPVTGTTAALRTAVLEVLEALDAMASVGFTLEHASGQPLIEVDPELIAGSVDYDVRQRWGNKGWIGEVSVRIPRIDASQVGTGTWQIQRIAGGRMLVVGTLQYAALADALADVAAMRSGAVRPAWMPSSCRVVEDTAGAGQAQGSIDTLPSTSYRPVEMTVIWEQMAAHMANSSAFNDVKRAKWKVRAVPRPPINDRAGQDPGFDVTIEGTIEFKTEQSTTYDAADTAVTADQAMRGKVVACISVLKAVAEARAGVAITLLVDHERDINGEDGVYQFSVNGVSGGPSRVMGWEETETIEEAFRGQIAEGSDGSEWEFGHSGGDARTVHHSLDISSIGGFRPYVKPASVQGSNWRRIVRADDQGQSFRTGAAPRQYKISYRRVYRYVNPVGGAHVGGAIPGAQGVGRAFDSEGYFSPTGPDV